MNEAELESLLIKHFHPKAAAELAGSINRIIPHLEHLPPQVRSYWVFDCALLDWKLDFSWARVGLLAGSTAGGVILGVVFGPALDTCSQRQGTAIAYALSEPECPAVCER